MHSFNKLITKCLARRFAKVLNELVQQNQSAFIKGHTIHGNFRSIQLTCKALHAKRDSCLVLKIDVAKAFDSVSGPFLLASLAHLGFSARCKDWTSLLLSTASTRILLNGRPWQRMLFVLVMEVLNALIMWVDGQGLSTSLRAVRLSVKRHSMLMIWFFS